MDKHNTFGGAMSGEQNFYLTGELSQHLLTSDDKYKDLLLQWKGSVFILCLFFYGNFEHYLSSSSINVFSKLVEYISKAARPDSVDMIFCLELQLEAL